MKILLLAPHPFFQERGTPIAVDLLVKTLSARGDEIDIVTFHEGSTPDYPGSVRVHRIPAPPLVRGLRPGFSLKKVVCDLFLWRKAAALASMGEYDVIHAVEEAVFIALRIGKRRGIPVVYDMDSSMPQQMAAKQPLFRPLLPLMTRLEGSAIRRSLAVVPMCDALAAQAVAAGAKKVVVLRDISMLRREVSGEPGALRRELGIRGTSFLYLGNLEPYQGIDLLLEAFRIVAEMDSEAGLIVAGGNPGHVEHYRHRAAGLGLSGRTHFVGPWPLADMAGLFENADVLVSPRTAGENTPMKIYSYLASGKAVLATDLPTHTQVLDDTVSVLEAAEPASFARGMGRLVDPALRRRLGDGGRVRADQLYSREAFGRTVDGLYDWIAETLPGRGK